eukprot:SM000123S25847  [mRNA]  locus=s123:218045:219857:- [translate_table: standard]
MARAADGVAFTLKQSLAPGTYSYKFIVDGRWRHAPDQPSTGDGVDGFNNTITIQAPPLADAEEKAPVQPAQGASDVEAKDALPSGDSTPPQANATEADSLPKQSPSPLPKDKGDEENGKPAVKVVTGEATAAAKADEKKPAGKAAGKKATVVRPIGEVMNGEVIPQLAAALQKEPDVSSVDLTFADNQLRGSFVKGPVPYCFWAYFPSGTLEGPRGFSLTSHGGTPSTVEPFLIDERKITAELLVFWVRKRLFAQKILSLN